MDRRLFLNSIGAAIIGTAIYLKIPNSIAPTSLMVLEPVPEVVLNAEPYVVNIWNYKAVRAMRKANGNWDDFKVQVVGK